MHSIDWIIRPAIASDASAMASMHVVMDDPWSQQTFDEIFSEHGYDALCMESNGHMIAFLVYKEILNIAEILTILVDPSFQGYGYGKSLLQYFLHSMQKQGFQQVDLEVSEANGTAIAMYEKLFFQLAGRRKSYYCVTINGNIFYKDGLLFSKILKS